MLRTLRGQFVLSHVLPLLVIVPLMGIALIYFLETRVLLPGLSSELTNQALLLGEMARETPDVFEDPAHAQPFVNRMSQHLSARVMLLDTAGVLLASSDPADLPRLGQPLALAGLQTALAGQATAHETYNTNLKAEVADVIVPVRDGGHEILGAIRLTYRFTSVYERFLRLRYFIGGVLLAGVLAGGAIGWGLAINLERPLQRVTQAVEQLDRGPLEAHIPEEGPEEVSRLVNSLNTLSDRLGNLEKARAQLLANLVHEMGRPLGALRSAVQALRSGADDRPDLRADFLAGIDEELHLLQRLLDDLAHLHGQVLGPLELSRRRVEVGAWLHQVLIAWRDAALRKGLGWETNVEPDLTQANFDPDRLAQALGNLVSNSVKYTPAGGVVRVEAGTEAGQLWIRVSDTGPGIPPEDQSRVFEPFFRGQRGRRFPQGMGLGLTIARDIVGAHGGHLEVESTVGRGSRFTIYVPQPAGQAPTPDV